MPRVVQHGNPEAPVQSYRPMPGYSIPGIVLGLILGKIGEQTFAQAMQMMHYDMLAYLSRPISAALLAAGLITLLASIYGSLTHKASRDSRPPDHKAGGVSPAQ